MTDPQGHAAATSLVTAGTVLLGSVLLARYRLTAVTHGELKRPTARDP